MKGYIVISRKNFKKCQTDELFTVATIHQTSKKALPFKIFRFFYDDRAQAKKRRRRCVDFVKQKLAKWEPTQGSFICSNHLQRYFAMNFVVNYLIVLQLKNMKLVVCKELEGPVDRLTVHLL
jgi:hypothetical protein